MDAFSATPSVAWARVTSGLSPGAGASRGYLLGGQAWASTWVPPALSKGTAAKVLLGTGSSAGGGEDPDLQRGQRT